MLNGFKIGGLLIGLIGIALLLLELLGYFVDGDRIALRDRIQNTPGRIPRSTPAFDKFVEAFPPPDGVDQVVITHIVKDIIQTHDGFPVIITVRYLAADQKTRPVASYADVEKWASETRFGWWSWIAAALGWAAVAGVELYQIFRPRERPGT